MCHCAGAANQSEAKVSLPARLWEAAKWHICFAWLRSDEIASQTAWVKVSLSGCPSEGERRSRAVTDLLCSTPDEPWFNRTVCRRIPIALKRDRRQVGWMSLPLESLWSKPGSRRTRLRGRSRWRAKRWALPS